jgi:hypothetical protein
MNNTDSFPGTGDAVEQKIADPNNVRALLASFLANRKKDAIRLLQVNGVSILPVASDKAVQKAYLKGITQSEAFRSHLTQLLTDYTHSLPADNSMQGFVVNKQYQNLFDASDVAGTGTTTSTTPTTTNSGGGFWGSLKSIFTPDVIGAGIKTGLNAINTKITSDANQSSANAALEAERLRLAQIQAEQQLKATPNAAGSGMPKWLMISLGVLGAAALITGIVYMVKKKS